MKWIVTRNYHSYADLVKSIHAHIQPDVKAAMKQIGEEIKKILYEYIEINWYAAYHPMNYVRTYEVLEALTVRDVEQSGDTTTVEIYFDDSKIHAERRPGEWNAHMSVTGLSATDVIVGWVNAGQSSPLYSYAGIDFIGNTMEELSQTNFVSKKMAEFLRMRGYLIK
jgi:hypothetical protein